MHWPVGRRAPGLRMMSFHAFKFSKHYKASTSIPVTYVHSALTIQFHLTLTQSSYSYNTMQVQIQPQGCKHNIAIFSLLRKQIDLEE